MNLPATIVLKAGPTLRAADLCAAFGVTRQTLEYYRKRHDLPQPSGKGCGTRYDTRAVTAWINARGVKINWC